MRKIIFILCLTVPGAMSASQIADFYVIPVVAHTSGANGTSWRTDVFIQNIQSTPLTVEMSLVATGEGLLDNIFPLSNVTVAPLGSVTLSDVLQNQARTSGALLVGGNHAFALTSRTYDRTPAGTVGQAVPPATDAASDGSSAASTLYIPGLISNAAFRTNLGLVMSATTPMTVVVTIDGPDGQALGARTFNVAAGMTTHVQFGTPSVAAVPFDTAGAIVRITAGTGTVISYASIVDNATADASFVSGGTAAAGAVSSLSALLPHVAQ